MKTIKIYMTETTKGFYADETGAGCSLSPWGEATEIYEGSDDGGIEYILPAGLQVATSESGSLEIYDDRGNHCPLTTNKHGVPMLICSDGQEKLQSFVGNDA